MDRKTELSNQIAILQEELSKIEVEEEINSNKKYVGKYYIYKNGYGSDEHWNLYIYVESIDEHGSLIVKKFQKTSDNEIEFKTSCKPFMYNAREISKEEFMEAYNTLRNEVNTYFS